MTICRNTVTPAARKAALVFVVTALGCAGATAGRVDKIPELVPERPPVSTEASV